MNGLTKQELKLLKLKRLIFLNDLRDCLNQVPEDISCIFRLERKADGAVKISAREENGWHMMTRLGSVFHRKTASGQGPEAKFNRKFVKPDEFGGSSEAVICFPPGKEPYLVCDPVNCGTYNFISPVRARFPLVSIPALIGHFSNDVLPYLKQNRVSRQIEELLRAEEREDADGKKGQTEKEESRQDDQTVHDHDRRGK